MIRIPCAGCGELRVWALSGWHYGERRVPAIAGLDDPTAVDWSYGAPWAHGVSAPRLAEWGLARIAVPVLRMALLCSMRCALIVDAALDGGLTVEPSPQCRIGAKKPEARRAA